MQKWIILILLLTGNSAMAADTTLAQDMQTIAKRLQEEWTQRTIPESRVQEYLKEQNPDGSWPNINYTDRSRTHWSPAQHTQRLSNLAEAYGVSKNEALKEAVLKALQFWVTADPESDNWWFNCINSPRNLGRTLLLMGDAVPDDLLQKTIPLIRRSTFKRTGANLTWEAGNLMVLACATNDADLLRESISYLTKEIRITTEEGVQPDFSFHQHGPQLYMSNYGEAFSGDNSRYAALFAGTSFALSKEKIAALSGLIREGQQWFIWGRQFDYHAMGRQIDSPGAYGRGRSFIGIANRMTQVDPDHAEEYTQFAKRVSGALPPDAGLTGNRYFYRSDIMVHRPGNFYVSVRMHSTRVYATEVRTNRENLKGYHLSDGTYFLMQRGDEFRDIQPVWDWRKLPGVTYRDTNDPFPYGRDAKQAGNTDFVGGLSNGTVGIAAMDLAKEDVRAHKSYFFFDHGFLCLGAGIQTETNEHATTDINQCLLNGDVLLLNEKNNPIPITSKQEIQSPKAVYHDSIGYYFPKPQKIVIAPGPQTGTWTSIEERSSRHNPVTQQVFNMWVDHGPHPKNATYAYAIMPGIDQKTFTTLANTPPFEILANTSDLQAVTFPKQNLTQAAFFSPNTLTLPNGPNITAKSPCLLLLQQEKQNLTLSLSDPTQKLFHLTVILDGTFEGNSCIIEGQTTRVTVALPQKEWAGKTVQIALTKK